MTDKMAPHYGRRCDASIVIAGVPFDFYLIDANRCAFASLPMASEAVSF